MLKQQTLLQCWNKTEQEHSKYQYKSSVAPTAKETLEPHFVRSIPEDDRYIQRLKEEYALIDRNAFSRVFLQVKKILELIEELGKETNRPIPHIIRGSAGSSLVCFLLGITQIDPILYGIELARFMNVCRTDIPDIDIDVPYNRRQELYGKIAAIWQDQVARVSNHIQWKSKSALRESAKTILKKHDQTPETKSALRAVARRNFSLAKVLPDASERAEATQMAKEKEGSVRGHSLHCGGIVVFEESQQIPENLVLKELSVENQRIVQLNLNKDEVEDAGFIKIDVLSNRGLAQLADVCPNRPLTSYPRRDAATERIFAKGQTIGVTFGESRGMRKLFVEMQPRNIQEVAIALALIRPAAAAEGRKQEFLQKWKLLGRKANEDPAIAGLLRPIIFDDDAILKIRRAVNCSAAEADRWRKAFAKGNAKARIEFRQKLQEAGHSKHLQDTIVDDLNQLIYYSFCKSHAISYAQLVWALAYWKAHHPHAFWCAALNHCHSEYRKWVHYREAKLSGLTLSREPPPYILGMRGGKPALIPTETQEQALLVDENTPQQAISDMRTHGYWLTEEFLPTCGLQKDTQKRLDGLQKVKFRGLIATGRVVHRAHGTCTLICLGVGNGHYIDLVWPNQTRQDLFRYCLLEGIGILKETSTYLLETVEIQTIHGVSLKKLL